MDGIQNEDVLNLYSAVNVVVVSRMVVKWSRRSGSIVRGKNRYILIFLFDIVFQSGYLENRDIDCM
jgi:hypothetical protein